MKTTGALSPTQLYGLWQLALWTQGGSAEAPASTGTLQFERHPEYCSREIRGLRHPIEERANAEPAMNFLLKKAPGWR